MARLRSNWPPSTPKSMWPPSRYLRLKFAMQLARQPGFCHYAIEVKAFVKRLARAIWFPSCRNGVLELAVEYPEVSVCDHGSRPEWSDDENGIAAIQRSCRAGSRHRCVDERACRGIGSHRASVV